MGCNASAPKVVRTPTEVNSARLTDREKSKLLSFYNYSILLLRELYVYTWITMRLPTEHLSIPLLFLDFT
jgi:hypothetical protein